MAASGEGTAASTGAAGGRRVVTWRRRVVSLLVVAATLAVTVGSQVVPSRVEPASAAIGAVNLLFTRPGTTPRYTANQVVALEAGNINFVGNCKVDALRQTPGIGDRFQPFADLYIVPAGSTYLNNTRLVDVSGAANVVHGGLAGSFLYEPLGATFPTGNLGSGVYGVVVDECQNGVFDTGEDTFVDNAFRVVLNGFVPPVNPELQAYVAMKASAASFSSTVDQIEQILKLKELLEKTEQIQSLAAATANVEAFTVFVINGVVGALAEQAGNFDLRKRAQELAQETAAQHRTRLSRLAADPPDPNYTRFALPAAAGAYVDESTGAFYESWAAYLAQHDALSALSGGILDALERYQGAQAKGDQAWAVRHARTASRLIDLYHAQAASFRVASDALGAAISTKWAAAPQSFANRIRVIDDAFDRLVTEASAVDTEFLNSGADRGAALAIGEAYQADFAGTILDNAPDDWLPIVDRAEADIAAFDAGLALVAADLDGLTSQLGTALGGQDRDPELSITVTGSPVAGGAVTLAVAGLPGDAAVAWDLDGDGQADDASGASVPWTVPTAALVGAPLVVSATAAGAGFQGVATTVVTVAAGGNRPPTIAPNDQSLRAIAPGASTTMTVLATDPDGDALSYEWFVDGRSRAGTTPTFTLTTEATEFGGRWIDVLVTDARGAVTRHSWMARIVTPDADGDGYMAAPGPDCLDVPDATGVNPRNVHPARAEVAGNGADDDCDPATPDDGTGTVGSVGYNGPSDVIVGQLYRPTTFTFNHPQKLTGIPFRLTVDWGDGSPVHAQTVAGTTSAQTALAIPEHRYARPAGLVTVEACLEVVTTGYRRCAPTQSFSVLNNRPIVNGADLRTWGPVEKSPIFDNADSGDWSPLDPEGRRVLSGGNVGSMTILASPVDLPDGGYGRGALDHQVLREFDNDDIGVLFGYQPGEASDENADYVGVVWSNNDNYVVTAAECNDAPAGSRYGPLPFSAWRQKGVSTYGENYNPTKYDYPYDPSDDLTADGGVAQDPRCSDDQGPTTLGSVPRGADDDPTRTDTGLDWDFRINQTGEGEGAGLTLDPYLIEYEYRADRLQVWVDGDLHLDVTPTDPANPFPPGRFALMYRSQTDIRAALTRSEPTFAFVQGRGGEFSTEPADGIAVPMHDSPDDTYTTRVSWGDGTSTTEGTVTPDPATGWGWFTIADTHVYERAGTFRGDVCATDQYGLGMCFPFTAVVSNLPPVVDAGPDRPTGPRVTLSDMTFQDPGRFDTHTATVDWGDGAGPQPATITGALGGGTVTASHTYDTDGPRTIELCVTDQSGGVACDTRVLDVFGVNRAPQLLLEPAPAAEEGREVTIPFGFTDANVDDTHTVTVDWADGAGAQPVTLQDGGDFGSGEAARTYGADGSYTVTVQVCDQDGACSSSSLTVVVAAVAPTPSATVTLDGATGSLTAIFTDPGQDETYTASVDWGDATAPDVPAVVPAPGGGAFTGTHLYGAAGQYDVQVCVRDEDGTQGCTTVTVVVSEVPGTAPTVGLSFATGGVEGDAVDLTVTVTDPDAGDTHVATLLWGDGTPAETLAVDPVTRTATARRTTTDDATFPVSVEVCDSTARCTTGTASATVANAAPAVEAGRDRTGGPTLTLDDSAFTDAGRADTHTATVRWGDGSPVVAATVVEGAGAGSVQADHTYAADGVFTVEVCVTDDDGGTACDTFVVTVEPPNVDVTVTAPAVVGEGSPAVLDVGFTDARGGTHTVLVRWGDGSAPTAVTPIVDGTVGTASAAHVYADDGVYAVTVEVCGSARCGTATADATVTNVTPDVGAVTGTPVGRTLSVAAAFTDPGGLDAHTAVVDWGDGTTSTGTVAGRTVRAEHEYGADGTYTVEVCVTDDAATGCASAAFAVAAPVDQPPSVQLVRPSGLREGTSFVLGGTAADPEGGPLSVVVDWGDGTTSSAAPVVGQPFTLGHTYADDGSYDVVATVSDGNGTATAALDDLAVANDPPALTGVPATASVALGAPFTLTGGIADPGADTHVVTVERGGAPQPAAVTGRNWTWTTVFTTAGTVPVTVSVCDDEGACGSASLTVTVVDATVRDLLVVSSSAQRTSPTGLDGETLSGRIHVFVDQAAVLADTGSKVSRVDFSLDGSPFSVEEFEGFDLARTAPDGTAYPLDTTLLSDGTHSVTATIVLKGGARRVVTETFTVSNGAAAKAVVVSTSAGRANAVPLAGAALRGKVAIFLSPTTTVVGAKVTFAVDGRKVITETIAPYDLAGTAGNGTAILYDLSKLKKGGHRVTMTVELPSSVKLTREVTFTVV